MNQKIELISMKFRKCECGVGGKEIQRAKNP
jgi:hypothetical protein